MNLPDLLAGRTLPALAPSELVRYGRHLTLPSIGMVGQQRLKSARVLLVGAGGLGSPLGLYLAAAGIGCIGVVDSDRVEASNLQRQVLFGQSDVGRPKVEVAQERIGEINPHVAVEAHGLRLDADNVSELIEPYDVVVDGSDNFPTRYLINDACVLCGKPEVWGAVQRFEGQVAVFWSQQGPCYRCLFPEPPPAGMVPSCAQAGVLGMLPGMVGAMQANEVIKLLVGAGQPLIGRLLVLDALAAAVRTVRLQKSPECPICGPRATIHAPIAYHDRCDARQAEANAGANAGAGAGDRAVSRGASDVPFEIDSHELRCWQGEGREIVLLDVREPYERQICRLEGSVGMPLGTLADHASGLDPHQLTVVYCHHGTRSAQAVAFLRRKGFSRTANLGGGIDAWSLDIDPTLPRY